MTLTKIIRIIRNCTVFCNSEKKSVEIFNRFGEGYDSKIKISEGAEQSSNRELQLILFGNLLDSVQTIKSVFFFFRTLLKLPHILTSFVIFSLNSKTRIFTIFSVLDSSNLYLTLGKWISKLMFTFMSLILLIIQSADILFVIRC